MTDPQLSHHNTKRNPWYGARKVGPDIFEVMPYFGKMKMMFGIVAAGCIAVFIYEFVLDQQALFEILGAYGILWEKSDFWQHSYHWGCLEMHNFGCTSKTTFREMLQLPDRQTHMVNRYANHAFLFFVFFSPFFIFILWRRPAPIRFNVKLGAVYTWQRHWLWGGALYILPERNFDYKVLRMPDGLQAWSRDYGPLRMTLRNTRWPRQNKRFQLGPYMTGYPNQGEIVVTALRTMMRAGSAEAAANELRWDGWDPTEPTTEPLPYPWYHRSLFGARKLPADIDSRAETWMRANGKAS